MLRERAEFLTGADARARIAALYVTLGDADFDGVPGKDDLGRPKLDKNFARAREAYATALDVGVAAADRLRVRARLAEALEAIADWNGAIAAWDALVGEKDAGPAADPEAWLVGRGRARLRAALLPQARKDLKDALAAHPAGKRHLEILRLLADERFLAAAGPEGELAFDEGVGFLTRADQRASRRQGGPGRRATARRGVRGARTAPEGRGRVARARRALPDARRCAPVAHRRWPRPSTRPGSSTSPSRSGSRSSRPIRTTRGGRRSRRAS